MNRSLENNIYLKNNINIHRVLLYILCFVDVVICLTSFAIVPFTLVDFSAAALGFFLTIGIGFAILLYFRLKCDLYLEESKFYSEFFLHNETPFVNITTLPFYNTNIGFSRIVRKKYKNDTLRCIDGAIKKGYLVNCTVEIHKGVPYVALAKRIVKDKCPNCGAPIVDAVSDIYVCKYCGKKIFNVVKKK